MDKTIYTVNGQEFELRHYGVKGMKWGRRKARPEPIGVNRGGGKAASDSPEAQAAAREARRQKAKRAAMIGGAVVGTALAAYGGYKLAKYAQEKRSQNAMQKAQDYINKNIYRKVGDTQFQDGTRMMDFVTGTGNRITTQGTRGNVGKVVGQHNAKVMAAGKQIYADATNTRLDRGLSKVVNTGDAIGNAAKRTGSNIANKAKSAGSNIANKARGTATKAKNAVLDTVNPVYEYTPNTTTRTWRDSNGIDWTESVTNYHKKKKRR